MKRHTTISIDSELMELAKLKNINISHACEIALQSRLNYKVANPDMEKNQLRKKEILKQILNLQEELTLIENANDKYKEEYELQEMDKLEKQKAELELISKCKECGEIIGEGSLKFDFPIGTICHGCFRGGKGKLKKWELKE